MIYSIHLVDTDGRGGDRDLLFEADWPADEDIIEQKFKELAGAWLRSSEGLDWIEDNIDWLDDTDSVTLSWGELFDESSTAFWKQHGVTWIYGDRMLEKDADDTVVKQAMVRCPTDPGSRGCGSYHVTPNHEGVYRCDNCDHEFVPGDPNGLVELERSGRK